HHHVTPLTRLSISSYFTTLPFSPKHRISPMPDFTCVEQRGHRAGVRMQCNRSALKGRNNPAIPNVSLIEFNAMPYEQRAVTPFQG
ncbi:MAG: hypothetical protein ACLQNE_12865, partial [Thermoguttaceae bacterium]